MSIRIGKHLVSRKSLPFVVAELSGNHNGSIDIAKQTLKAAKESGASGVKLQTYTPDTVTIDCGLPEYTITSGLWAGSRLYDLYKVAHTPYEWHQELFAYARAMGLEIFSTPFDSTAVELLAGLDNPVYKIASFEITDLQLLREVGATGKPMILSTGLASLKEIETAMTAATVSGCPEILLLHCVSGYPTEPRDANVRRVMRLRSEFGVEVGLSDHTTSNIAAIAAVAYGAPLIEKHFILDRQLGGPDSDFSLNPQEFCSLVSDVTSAWYALGDGESAPRPSEKNNILFRRSIRFTRDLVTGHVITEDDVRVVRPSGGLSPENLQSIIGRTLKYDVVKGQATSFDMIG